MTVDAFPEESGPQQGRLFAAGGPSLAEHHGRFGSLPEFRRPGALAALLDEAGLVGRGGAGFPTGRKISTATGRGAIAIGNGAEGEPESRKDATLLAHAPHLVLDGLILAGEAIGARELYLYVPTRALATVRAALDERHDARWHRPHVNVIEAPDTFVAGEKSAVVSRVEGGPALPRDQLASTAVSGVRGRPTLVQNVETLAHIGLIARYGPRWFRSVGDPSEPGTMLVTLSGAIRAGGVVEVPTGVSIAELISHDGGTDLRTLRSVLVGGYHGTWLTPASLGDFHLCRPSMARAGASPGAGIVHALAIGDCGLARSADIVTYLAEQSAGQCGPCINGLPRLAQLLTDLAYGTATATGAATEIRRIADLVDGRGSCRHPDGTARFVRSALDVFASDALLHNDGQCEALLTTATGHDSRKESRV
nr:NADH-ubiquinone oxidoreductase-F iron-sulfur binding region domain-containing protein [Rhodococcus wratislaviensis]GLK39750.1 NADH dehydrogenase [Rhodococcus wratislaviensis]